MDGRINIGAFFVLHLRSGDSHEVNNLQWQEMIAHERFVLDALNTCVSKGKYIEWDLG